MIASLLTPFDINAHLDRIIFTPSQICTIAGISRVQLDYWIEKAEIEPRGTPRSFSIPNLELILLIREARMLGLNLSAAVAAAREAQILHRNNLLDVLG